MNKSLDVWSNVSTLVPLLTTEANTSIDAFPSCDIEYLEFRNNSRFWVQRVLVPIIMIIGVIGNSITIVIMTRRKMRSSTNSYLAALATFDMMYLIFIFVLSLTAYPNIQEVQFYHYWHFRPFAIMIADASSNTSIWLTVTFTIERYIAVCHPIKGKVLCTESRAKRVIFCVFLVCFTFTLPTPFEWVVVERNSTEGRIYYEIDYSPLGLNDLYRTIYYYLNVILFALIPFLLLAIFNAFLIRSVHISHKKRNDMIQCETSAKMDPTSKQESRITIMLIAVVILFFLCQLPTASVLIYSVFYSDADEDNSNTGCLIRGLGNIFNFLLAINATGNFVLYCLLSQKYRRTFVTLFCPCLKNKFFNNQSGGYQRTFYTQVANHNIHKLSENELNIRFRFNDGSRRMSSPKQKLFHSNQHLNTGRLSTGSLTPYLTENRRAMKCSLSTNYLQVPITGSTSRLMYDNSGSGSVSSVSCDEDNVSSDTNDKHNDSNHEIVKDLNSCESKAVINSLSDTDSENIANNAIEEEESEECDQRNHNFNNNSEKFVSNRNESNDTKANDNHKKEDVIENGIPSQVHERRT